MVEKEHEGQRARVITALLSVCFLFALSTSAWESHTRKKRKRKKEDLTEKMLPYPKKCQNFQNKKCKHDECFPAVLHIKISWRRSCLSNVCLFCAPSLPQTLAHKSTYFLCLKSTQCQAHTFPIKAWGKKTGNAHLLSNKRNEPENAGLKRKRPKRWNLVSLRKWVFCFLSTARQLTFTALIEVDWL